MPQQISFGLASARTSDPDARVGRSCCNIYHVLHATFERKNVTLETYNCNITKSQLQLQKYSRNIRNSGATSSKYSPFKHPLQHQEHSPQHQNRHCNIVYIKIYLPQQCPSEYCNIETFDGT